MDDQFDVRAIDTKKLSIVFLIEDYMASYTNEVAKIHRQFNTALKRAKSRQAVLNAYWAHKKQHERLLQKHLREEMAQVNRIKNRLDYK